MLFGSVNFCFSVCDGNTYPPRTACCSSGLGMQDVWTWVAEPSAGVQDTTEEDEEWLAACAVHSCRVDAARGDVGRYSET